MTPMEPTTSRLAWILGLLGLLPFAAAALGALAVPSWREFSLLALLAYGACILSFLGAVHWGIALRAPESEARANIRRLVLGVAPSLVAWVALLLPVDLGLWLLVLGVLATAGTEQWATLRGQLPAGYMALRWVLSLGAAACLLAGALA